MPRTAPIVCLAALTFLSCHPYEFYAELDYQQASYTNEVDILFITDNSDSMEDENAALGVNFDRFMANLVEAQRTEEALPHEDLGDAVAASLYYVGNFSRFIDYQVAMTTTEIVTAPTAGQSGSLVEGAILTPQTEDIEGEFSSLVEWVQYHTASVGVEQGLDALRLAVCRGLDNPDDFDQSVRGDLKVGCCDLPPDQVGSNAGLLRPGAPLAVVITTDEGDFTDFSYAPGHCDAYSADPDDVEAVTVDDYLDFFNAAGLRVVASVIGPTVPGEGEEGVLCNPFGSPYRNIDRYQELVEGTRGLLIPICDPANPTQPNPDFATALNDIGTLISNLQNRFKLERAPDVESILVVVDDILIPEDPDNGWAYIRLGDEHLIEFRGEAVPSYEARVEIYYRPAEGEDPRGLPF